VVTREDCVVGEGEEEGDYGIAGGEEEGRGMETLERGWERGALLTHLTHTLQRPQLAIALE
jgi:hypothetical protein